MKRRSILQSGAALGAAALLAACDRETAAQVSQQAETYVAALETGLTALAPVLPTIAGVPAATVTAIQGYFTQAGTVLTCITTATTQAAGQSAFGKAETYVNEGLALLAGFTLPPKIQVIVTAAQVALPVIETALNAAGAAVGAPSPTALQAIATLQNAKTILAS